jgi:hypothetical protein
VLSVLVVSAVVVAFLVPVGTPGAGASAAPSFDALAVSSRAVIGHADPDAPVPTGPVPTSPVPASTPPAPVAAQPPASPPTSAAPRTAPVADATSAGTPRYGCASAIAYLHAHAAPGFAIECPGYAEGHQAMTCDNVAGVCPGAKVIAISVPCPAAYMNEASNSWVVEGQSHEPIDPYGYCH